MPLTHVYLYLQKKKEKKNDFFLKNIVFFIFFELKKNEKNLSVRFSENDYVLQLLSCSALLQVDFCGNEWGQTTDNYVYIVLLGKTKKLKFYRNIIYTIKKNNKKVLHFFK